MHFKAERVWGPVHVVYPVRLAPVAGWSWSNLAVLEQGQASILAVCGGARCAA